MGFPKGNATSIESRALSDRGPCMVNLIGKRSVDELQKPFRPRATCIGAIEGASSAGRSPTIAAIRHADPAS